MRGSSLSQNCRVSAGSYIHLPNLQCGPLWDEGTPTIVVQEEEEESVHDGDEDATPERDSETRVAWVSRPSELETVKSHLLGALTQVPQRAMGEGSGSMWRWKMAQNTRGRAKTGGGPVRSVVWGCSPEA